MLILTVNFVKDKEKSVKNHAMSKTLEMRFILFSNLVILLFNLVVVTALQIVSRYESDSFHNIHEIKSYFIGLFIDSYTDFEKYENLTLKKADSNCIKNVVSIENFQNLVKSLISKRQNTKKRKLSKSCIR